MSSSTSHAIILALAIVCLLATLGSVVVSLLTDFIAPYDALERKGISMPPVYVVDAKYDTPVKNQGMGRRSSWLFAFVGLLEIYFRSYNYDTNTYVPFSEQAFGKALADACERYSNSTLCQFSHIPEEISGSSTLIPDFIQDAPELENFLYPESVCPYQKSETSGRECPTLPPNPLRFKITGTQFASTVMDIKELLYLEQKPLLFSMPELYANYYLECTDPRVSEVSECSTEGIGLPCPFDQNKKCGIFRYPARTQFGSYFIPESPARPSVDEPVNFLIYGYVDDFIVSRGLTHLKTQKMPKGGFIVKPAFSANQGYPINFYTGQLAYSFAHGFCPNSEAPEHWLGAPLSCLRNSSSTRCPAITPKPSSKTGGQSADVLTCINTQFCSPEYKYLVTQLPSRTHHTYIEEDETGATVTPMFRYKKFEDREEIAFNELPFYRLGDAFTTDSFPNDEDNCGYWFIPYEVVQRAGILSTEAYNGVMAMAVDVKFSTTRLKDITAAFADSTQTTKKRLVNEFEEREVPI